MGESPKTNRTLPGIRIGHATDLRGLTGATVILCERGAVCAVDVRGGAAGTRDLETCRPGHIVERVHAILLTGGSAFGLDSAAGVMRYLESRGVGFRAGKSVVPIVPAACIFDLNVGSAPSRPDAAMALRACRAAAGPGGRIVVEGSVGAGTGATVGKINGIACAMKGGVGFASVKLGGPGGATGLGAETAPAGRISTDWSFPRRGSPREGEGRESMELGGRTPRLGETRKRFEGGATVQALAVVNAFGDVLNPNDGSILAGARRAPRSPRFVGTAEEMLQRIDHKAVVNTTLVVVMTDAMIDKTQLKIVTQMTHDGFARAISPVHTRFDGDLAFGLSLGSKLADVDAIGMAAAEAAAQAIVRAVQCALGLGGVPSLNDLSKIRG